MVILGLFGGYGFYLYKKNKELYAENILLKDSIDRYRKDISALYENY